MQTEGVTTKDTNPVATTPLQDNESASIETKYGVIEVNLENAIFFPKGIIGMPEMKDFILTDFPDDRFESFKLLQSLNDHQLSFVVLPIAIESNPYIDDADIEECSEISGVALAGMVMIAIVSVQRLPSGVKLTANMRAPVVIDAEEKLAIQYVFPNNKYDIRHTLNP